MLRVLPIVLAVGAIAAGGCGSDVKARNDYVDAVNKAQNGFAASFDRLSTRITSTSSPAQDQRTLDGFRQAVDRAVTQLRAIQVPVMMADGDHDEVIVLDQIEEMSKLIPNGQLKVFGDASHFALWQDPDSFNQAMVEFLSAAPPMAAASGSTR